MEEQSAEPVVKLTLGERAAAFASADQAVKSLEKKREALEAQIAAINKEIAVRSATRDKAQAELNAKD